MENSFLDKMKVDAIGEIQNVSMGSAASAVANMIGETVSFIPDSTSPCKAEDVISLLMEPDKKYIYVKIDYTSGINGSSVLVLNQNDMQIVVKSMMGMPPEAEEDFVFDEMYISGVSEVMNQMMGAAVTSLSHLLSTTISISSPDAAIPEQSDELFSLLGISADSDVCASEFTFNIENISSNKFIIVLSEELAKDMADKMVAANPDMFPPEITPEEFDEAPSNTELIDSVKIDAIGEFENIAMGASATALSKFLGSKVDITTPRVCVNKASAFAFDEFEPSVSAKIDYVEGINGSSVLVLKQSDVQIMINKLMGLPLEVSDDFEFNEMNISAVCEMMNQMMGASATALSELTAMVVDISPPKAAVIEKKEEVLDVIQLNADDDVCAISFDLNIDGVIQSHFISMLSIELANDIADKMMMSYSNALDSYEMTSQEIAKQQASSQPAAAPAPEAPKAPPLTKPAAPSAPKPVPKPVAKPVPKPVARPAPKPVRAGIPQPPPKATVTNTSNVNVQSYQMNSFGSEDDFLTSKQRDNLRSLMNVPMDVAIRIGSTEKRMDEILEFTKGTIIELDTLANEPVDVIVNGNLIAKGDVVVVDDNFAIRITEIINNNILNTLS